MVALIREPPRDDGPARRISLRSSHDEVDVSAIARSGGRRWPPAGCRVLAPTLGSTRSSSSSAASSRSSRADKRAPSVERLPACPASTQSGRDRPGRQAGRAVLLRDRGDAPRGGRGRGPAMPGRSTRSPRACWSCCPARQRGSHRASSGSTSDTSPTSTSRRPTSTGDPEGRDVERHRGADRTELDAALERLRGRSSCRPGGVRGEDRRRARLQARPPRGRGRDAPHAGRSCTRSTSSATTATPVRLSLHVSSGTYVRSVAQALGGHCTTLRRTAVGPFTVDEADADPATARLLDVESVLVRLPADAMERVTGSIRAGVLAAAAGGGVGAA